MRGIVQTQKQWIGMCLIGNNACTVYVFLANSIFSNWKEDGEIAAVQWR